jgi:membrane protein implicated in regulation of membrane protease activity
MEGVRVDTWVETGSRVSPYYDSLIGKLIVHAPTRAGAVARMQKALAATTIDGVRTNIDALVGQRGKVTQDFEHGLRLGRVSVAGDDWRAECINDQPLRIGDLIEVVRVDSNTLIVKPVPTN